MCIELADVKIWISKNVSLRMSGFLKSGHIYI